MRRNGADACLRLTLDRRAPALSLAGRGRQGRDLIPVD